MRMKKWMGVLGLAAFMAVGIPGNAGSGLRMTAQAAGSGEAAGDVRVFDQADLLLEEEEKELQQAIDALREKMDMDAAVVTAEENPGSAKTLSLIHIWDLFPDPPAFAEKVHPVHRKDRSSHPEHLRGRSEYPGGGGGRR